MPAAQHDFTIEQGATFTRAFRWLDATGNVVDLTGFTARMQVRANVASPDVLLELTTANDRLVIEPTLGRVSISLDATTTAAITWRKGVYDLELVSGAGEVTRLVAGQITVSREVTR